MGGTGGGGPTTPQRGSTRGVGQSGNNTQVGVDRCDLINESVRLSSPRPNVVAQLQIGDVLTLSIQNKVPPILVTTSGGQVAGSVVPSSLQTLLECMKTGYSYKATVESIRGGICIVRITQN